MASSQLAIWKQGWKQARRGQLPFLIHPFSARLSPPRGWWEATAERGAGRRAGVSKRRKPATSVRLSSLKILCCHDDTWFHLNLTFLELWANQCVFLMEMFFLSYVNETVYLLWNLPFFKMVPPKTNFWLITAQQTSILIHCFYGWGMTCVMHPISTTHAVGEGPGGSPQPWGASLIWVTASNRHEASAED